jgi:hypothetical protein
MPSTAVNDQKRSLSTSSKPRPGFGLTPQMVLSDSWSWANTLVAPKMSTATPTTVARVPVPASLAC